MKTTYQLMKSIAFALCTLAAVVAVTTAPSVAAEPVTAIDILLEPDETMVKHAMAANQRLRKNYPESFSLDETHRPHITVLQRFVKTADLDKVYEAVGKVLAEENPAAWKLKAFKYYYIPTNGLGLAGIVIEPTDDLIRFQRKVIDAVAPFTVKTGTAAAFVTTKEDPDITQSTIDYIAGYVPNQVGGKFNPHVTIGLAREDYLKEMLDEEFEDFTFSAAGVSVYQLGNFGTARKKLKGWELKPLSSWNDTEAKKALIAFVEKVTTPGSPDFVPLAERIAVFDNDGTLWPENPVPFQLAYALDTVKQMAAQKPALRKDPMVEAALTGDLVRLLEGPRYDGLLHIVALTHAGMTTDEFKAHVEHWLATARHPRYGKSYDQLTYQPMQELLSYLRANGFKTFIVSGGGADFMRVWSERTYGIPPEQIVGSTGRTEYELRPDGPVLIKTLNYLFVNDKEGKPVGIHEFIGRRPIACFGNSDGDKAMLEYTTIQNPRPSFGMIIHHTDAEREYAYDAKPKSTGKLAEALKDAPRHGWIVVDMKSDWSRVFASGP